MASKPSPKPTGWFYIAVFFVTYDLFEILNGQGTTWTPLVAAVWVVILVIETRKSIERYKEADPEPRN